MPWQRAPQPSEQHPFALAFARRPGARRRIDLETGVAVAPGVGFGEYGDQYVRLAFVENEQRIRQAARSIKKFLGGSASGGNVVKLQKA